jgi:Uncharacterized conserved protein
MKKLLLLLFGLSLFLFNSVYSSWYYSEWDYRVPITIQERSGNTLTDYQVMLSVNTANLISQGKLKSDCSDIRFTYLNTSDDKEYEIPYWIESGCNTTNTRIWIKVPRIPANGNATVYMYYGNRNAVSMSNGDYVFEFFDDFNDSVIDTNKWHYYTSSYGSIAETNGYLEIYRNGDIGAGIQSKKGFSGNYIVEYRVNVVSIGSIHHLIIGIMDVDRSHNGYGYWPFISSDGYFRIYKRAGTSWVLLETLSGITYTNTWYHFKIVKVGNSFTTYINGIQRGNTHTIS